VPGVSTYSVVQFCEATSGNTTTKYVTENFDAEIEAALHQVRLMGAMAAQVNNYRFMINGNLIRSEGINVSQTATEHVFQEVPASTSRVAATSITCLSSEQWNTEEGLITMMPEATQDVGQIVSKYYIDIEKNSSQPTTASESTDISKLLNVMGLAVTVISITSLIGWLGSVNSMIVLNPFVAMMSILAAPFVFLMGKAAKTV
jgi:hypothetical protein